MRSDMYTRDTERKLASWQKGQKQQEPCRILRQEFITWNKEK